MLLGIASIALTASVSEAHGTTVYPASRVYRVYQSNPSNPNFALARNAVQMDGALSYYTWNELSRNIPAAVNAGLPPGFDYSQWVPNGQLASGGRVLQGSPLYPRTYKGLDQISADWPTTPVVAGRSMTVRFKATAPHNPSVWDVWMTKPGWDPSTALNWKQMEFLGRPQPTLANQEYSFPLTIPADRSGHHVLWIAWQRNDPAGEVFFSASDIDVQPQASHRVFGKGCPGSNGLVPTLNSMNEPVVGQTYLLEADLVAPGANLILNFGRQSQLSLGTSAPGCVLLSTNDVSVTLGTWPGQKILFKLPIPSDPNLYGLKLSMQLVAHDTGLAHRWPIALSSGTEALLGVQ